VQMAVVAFLLNALLMMRFYAQLQTAEINNIQLMRSFLILSGCVLLLACIGIGFLYFNQEKIVFFPEVLSENYQFSFQREFRESNITLGLGQNINYLVFNPDSTKGVLLYFHGNAGSLKDWGFAASDIADKTGWAVWIMDYPGYGKSTGPLAKNEKILIEMGQALRDKIVNEKSQLPLVLFGRSVGSGIATVLASEMQPSGLILETPYRSIAKMGREIFAFLPESFSRYDLDNEKLLPSVDLASVLILHGTDDRVIPFYHGELLSELSPQARFVAIEGGGHNNLDAFSVYWPAVKNFLSALER